MRDNTYLGAASMRTYLAIFLLALTSLAKAQQTTCTALGQNPTTAFPVCASAVFTQNTVPICGNRAIPAPGCGNNLTDKNPYWYSFDCFQGGTLGFTITPHNLNDDYDWQIFDVTNVDPMLVYSNVNLTICCNWSGESGVTGTNASGTSLFVCDGFGKPLFSKMPTLIQGHKYLLLVSHFTDSQSGYDLAFGGGSAVITDDVAPKFVSATAYCGGTRVRVKLSKPVRCTSIATNGSDVFVTPAGINIISCTPLNCNNSFATDSLELTLGGALAPGNYVLNAKIGTDNNTILDFCNNAQSTTDKVNFTILPIAPTPMDSLKPVLCKPGALELVFKNPIACNSIASNGSDFSIIGSYPVTVTGAAGTCTAGYTNTVIVTLSNTMFNKGNFQIVLQQGTDGNTIRDECGLMTPAGSALPFSLLDTVNARFTAVPRYGCTQDTIFLSHPGGNDVNSWAWTFGNGQTSILQNPMAIYTSFGMKNISLEVSNGFCKDSASLTVDLANTIKAPFEVNLDNCPDEDIVFDGQGTGIRLAHKWTFGDGQTANVEDPTHRYPTSQYGQNYTIRYEVTDSIGCKAFTEKQMKIYSSCVVYLPNAFTPNNDGKNDVFRVLNAVKAKDFQFRIYNRWGQMVFYTEDWKQGWDGRFKGLPQASDTYVFLLNYTDTGSGEARQQKGSFTLIR